MTDLQCFLDCMEYRTAERRPNHELGVWGQTRERWEHEAPDAVTDFGWDWFSAEDAIGLDRREYVPMDYGFMPPFEPEVFEESDECVVSRNAKGIVTKALKTGTSKYGTRLCMDEYIDFPVHGPEDFPAVKKRLIAAMPGRFPDDLAERIPAWEKRQWPLILGHNCAANGFYWRAREFMGTIGLSLAWYDYPDLMHEMMEFYADLIIEVSRPVLKKLDVEYFVLNEDMSMKGGPLLGPDIYRTFIFPHLKRMVAFFKEHGTKYFAVDTDGDPTVLIPLMMDAGVDVVWPIERASDVSPQGWRKRFGKSLRLWGGVDKRILPLGREAICEHLREFIPLIEEGGFIPTTDHTVPPEVSLDNFRIYMDLKEALLRGEFAALGA